MSKFTKLVRDYVKETYPPGDYSSENPSVIMLLACADAIDRLIQERNEALAIVRQLTEVTHGHP